MIHPMLKSDRITVVDCDDTLAMWNLSDHPKEDQITIEHVNGPVQVVPNKKNINTLIKFWKLGYTIIVWSGSGYAWAEAVVKSFQLEKYVTLITSKPMYYFDDKPAESWIGPRVWRDPKTGKAD